MDEDGTRKRTFASILITWFPFLASPKSGGAFSSDPSGGGATHRSSQKSPARKKFSFRRRASDGDNKGGGGGARNNKNNKREREPESVTIDGTTQTIVTFKGDETTSGTLSSGDLAAPVGQRTSLKISGETTSLNDRPTSSRASMKKRPSSRRLKGFSRGKSQKFEITDDMMNLQRIILDPGHRQKLVELLVPLDGDSSVKVRFCCAVEEYQREKDKKIRNKKAAHIVRMFIRKGSMFRLQGLSKEYEKSLRAKRYDTLDTVKNVILDELVLNQVVAKTMKEILMSEIVKEEEEAADLLNVSGRGSETESAIGRE